MFSTKLNVSFANSQSRFCSSSTSRLTNLLKVMKKEPGRADDVLRASSLNLFKKFDQDSRPKKNLWTELKKEELKFYNQKPPKNAFEEMINWTNEGMLWKFPINNEDGLDKQKQERFTEHVFFDDIIEASPNKRPIRDFMNDAAIGLSKNSHMTAERKRSYLEWYNEYFNENKELVDTMIEEEDDVK